MAENVYECMFLFDSNQYARNPNGVSKQATDLIAGAGGEVLASRLWNEQKLAYPIEGHRKGVYWLTYFRIDTAKLGEFERMVRLNETVLRHLTLKVEPRLVETLVEHLRSGGGAVTPEEADREAKSETKAESEESKEPQTAGAAEGGEGGQ